MFLLALFLCLTSAVADTVSFLDRSYLKPTPPETLSVEAYSALPSVLTETPTHLSKNTEKELANLIADDLFQRPFVSWNVVLFGVTEGDFFLDNVVSLQLTGDGARLENPLASNGPNSDCNTACLVKHFSQGITTLGGSFASSDGLLGKAEMDTCGQGLDINDDATLAWATELGQIWNDLSILYSDRAAIDSPLHLRSIMTGLYLVRRTHGTHSPQFAFASCVTRSALFAIHKDLEIYFNRDVFVSVLMHSMESTLNDQPLDEVVPMMGRQLLHVKWFPESDASKTVEEEMRGFRTHSVGYVRPANLWWDDDDDDD